MQAYSSGSQDNEYEVEYRMDYGRSEQPSLRRSRRAQSSTSRATRRPSSMNGMHRRRNKRFSW